MRLRRTARAEQDLFDIWLGVAQDDLAAADRVIDRLEAATDLLADNPRMGPARPDIAAELRYFPVQRWLILYRVTDDAVEVVRYVHGARDLGGVDDIGAP